MPLAKLDDVCALIVIDLQKGIVGMPTVHPAGEIVDRSARLASAFRTRGFPVVLVNVSGMAPGRIDTPRPAFALPPDWTQLVPELGPQPTDFTVTKQRWGALIGTGLDEYLLGHRVTQVVITGVATTAGVESTARSAYDLGYNVTLVVDAMTDRDADAHLHAVEKIFPRLGEIAKTEEVLKLLHHLEN
jgi:nicotinamidase-related amidase